MILIFSGIIILNIIQTYKFKFMKTLVKKPYLWIVCLGLSLIGLASCSDKTDDFSSHTGKFATYVEPIDSVKVTSPLKTFMVPSNGSGYSTALAKRMTNVTPTLDESVKTLIINDDFTTLTDDDFNQLINALVEGKNLVYCNPTVTKFSSFCAILGLAIDQMRNDGEFTDSLNAGAKCVLDRLSDFLDGKANIPSMFNSAESTEGDFCDAIAFRGDNVYVVNNRTKSETKIFTADSAGNATTTTGIANTLNTVKSSSTSDDEITPYSNGLEADAQVEWLNEQPNEQKIEATRLEKAKRAFKNANLTYDGAQAISNISHAQYNTQDFSINCYGQTMRVTVTNSIYSVYNPEENADYYFITQNVWPHNKELNCGPADLTTWTTGFNFENGYYGPYFNHVGIENMLLTEDQKFVNPEMPLEYVQPTNAIGSTAHTYEKSFSLTGGLTLTGDGLGASLSGGLSWSESTTSTVKNISGTLSISPNQSPAWQYQAETSPTTHREASYDVEHNNLAREYTEDQIFTHYWIWKVKDPDYNTNYSLYYKVNFGGQVLTYEWTDWTKLMTHEIWWNDQTAYPQPFSLTLNAPPHAKQDWTMFFTPYSEKLENFLLSEVNLKTFAMPENFSLYAPSDQSRQQIDDKISSFMGKISKKSVINQLKSRGITGTFIFSWEKGDDDVYTTKTLTVQ
jgi:hypothetical protein